MLIAVCVYKWNTYLLNKIAMVLNQRIKQLWKIVFFVKYYSHFSNSRGWGGGNKPGRGTKVEKSINVQEGINEEVERNLRNQ